ncbi:asparagine synthase-related protein [Candidatus Nitrosarchaeum limnium]|uniref:Asparagine synthase n=1 Tax=Candidatus Nitrosarchaeum limnium BG20 TaxID=859192 RepID=S2EKH8_9ARCH|nr:asparagine synthase-related protein [Candidatus Nitrosarchaeum limnium]EPA05157.1 asparagine synthase [Candidatus Nitrosarchaeum limnium BG20]
MENSDPTLDALSLKSTLTLRYDSTQKPILQKLKWDDFTQKSQISTTIIENSIKKSILNSVGNSEPEKISISLSGGIDSSVVLLFLKHVFTNSKIKAITVKFSDSVDETSRAKDIANNFDVEQEILFIENYLEKLPQAINVSKLPFWDIHWYYVAEKAKKYSNYLASGDGGDELLGGYVFRYSKFLSLIRPNSTPMEKAQAYIQCHERDHVPDQESIFGSKSDFSWSDIYNILLPYFDNSLAPLEQVFLADYNGKLLYNFSILNTKIINSFGIKPIIPLLSNEMISHSIHMNAEEKYDKSQNIGKLPLRKILEKNDMLKFFDDQKLGFSVNTINLWNNYGHEICKHYLSDSRLVKDGWLDKNWILKHIDRKDLDVRYVNKFLGLLSFEIWYRMFVTGEFNPKTSLKN